MRGGAVEQQQVEDDGGCGRGADDERRGRDAGHAASVLTTQIAPIGQAPAASRTAGSSLAPMRRVALPEVPSSNTSGARSAQSPKPLHTEPSITMRYIMRSFHERVGWGGRVRARRSPS